VWAGDSQIKFFESPFEEVADLGPIEDQAAFFFSMGLTITGGRLFTSTFDGYSHRCSRYGIAIEFVGGAMRSIS
jgi:hypothetical protein